MISFVQVRNLIWVGLGVLGLSAAAASGVSPAKAQDFGKIDFSRLGSGAPANGVVMSQDDDKVYIYDAGKSKIFIISKNESVTDDQGANPMPVGYIVDVRDGTVSGLQPKRGK